LNRLDLVQVGTPVARPTFGHNLISDVGRYASQVQVYVSGVFEEFNLILVLVGLFPLVLYRRMQKRERAWIIMV
jgi:hypothetical protein